MALFPQEAARLFRYFRYALFGILAALISALPGLSQADGIKIGGSGGALGTMKLLAEAYKKAHPGTEITVLPSLGSGGGIKAMLGGAIEIAVSARPLEDAELRQGAVQRVLGRTPFVFAVAASSPVSSITLQEVKAIFHGELVEWPDGTRIRLVLRPITESDTIIVKKMGDDMARAADAAHGRAGMLFAVTDQETAESLERIPGAFGTTTLAQIISEERALKALALNGMAPNPKTIRSGAYPYSKTFYLVAGRSPGKTARRFIEFVFSERGRQILSGAGYWAGEGTPR